MRLKTFLILTIFLAGIQQSCFGQLYEYYLEMASNYLSIGDTENAVFYAKKAIAKDSTKAGGYYFLGSAYSDGGQFEEALQALKKAEPAVDEEIEVFYMLGHVYDRLGFFQESYAYFSKYVAIDSTSLFPLTRKAHIACKIEKYDEAKRILDHVLSIEPQRIQALNIYGLYHESREEYTEAISYFTRIIELDDADVTAYYNRCRMHAFLENKEENCADCKKASLMGIPDAEFFLLDAERCK